MIPNMVSMTVALPVALLVPKWTPASCRLIGDHHIAAGQEVVFGRADRI